MGQRWTAADDALLREFYANEGTRVAERLGRTIDGCKDRARKFGIRYDKSIRTDAQKQALERVVASGVGAKAMQAANTGKHRSVEVRANQSLVSKAFQASDEGAAFRERLRQRQYGSTLSEQTRAKMSVTRKGKHIANRRKGYKLPPRPDMCGDNNPARRAEVGAKISARKKEWWREHYNDERWKPYTAAFAYPLKQRVRARFGNQCVVCGAEAKVCHHIDYDKTNSTEANLVPLCFSCHGKSNYDRERWQSNLRKVVMPHDAQR